ncbi:MAG TPA: hypothetical protein VJS92_08400 [Candidatus Polarisedimenticolaceae bacterium]|nr:hypothetical protein [Candidatus Polarisedimenticolaceae bacterium]
MSRSALLRVLLVGDDPADAGLVHVLRERGVRLERLPHAASALSGRRPPRFDAALVDLRRQAREAPELDEVRSAAPWLPVIALVGDKQEHVRRAHRRGAQECVMLPGSNAGALRRELDPILDRLRHGRLVFEDRLRAALTGSSAGGAGLAVLHFRFAGPASAQAASKRLAGRLRAHDALACEGPSVLVLVHGVEHAEDAQAVAARLARALDARTVGIGVARPPGDGKDAITLLRRAAVAAAAHSSKPRKRSSSALEK